MMWFHTYIAICVCVLGLCVTNVLSEPWADRSLELLDEVNDVEIYKAVVSSMNEWERKRKARNARNARFKRQDTSVCYPELGCFESSGPFGYLDMLPNTPEEISTKFLLYPISSRRRRSGSEPIEIPFANITNAMTWSRQNFNNSLPTKILIHGFGSDCTHIWVYEMRSALLTVEECNVICVDWANGATLPNYVKASANTRLVGKQLAMFLKGLVDNVGLPLEKMHLVGFSLGAHVAGFAGSELGNLSRITGLDPAGPLFESQDPRARLDQTDAAFVDVIHSNGENLILGGLGSWQPMGHVDFYPNGGRMQKGCTNLFVGALTDIIWSAAVEGRSLCNHRRAYKFFTDSIHPRCHFPAFPCDSYDDFIAGRCFPCNEERKCGNMGYYADRVKGRGQLYLVTRDEEPFCAHQYLIKIESSPAEVSIVSYGRIQVTLIGDTLLNETFTLTKKEDEEMRLGESISKIIVPHPILLPPSQVQVVYTSYTGWLTSGLLQWKIDKISLSDSYGKSVSICKKNLILDSGVPVVLPLFPGDCKLPTTDEEDKYAEDRFDEKNRSKFVQNIEDKNSSIPVTDPVNEIIKSSWSSDKDNAVDNEPESSRAFNTRHVKSAEYPENKTAIREVVEPILKPQSTKHARSQNLNKERPEITEPILGPTTSKSLNSKSVTSKSVTSKSAISNSPTTKSVTSKSAPISSTTKPITRKEKEYPFYENRGSDWVPAVNLNKKTSEKWKREDDSKSISINHSKPQRNENGFEAIVRTVQFLPQRIARMFEDAEKYTRETILPFVSTYTPRFLSDFIAPRQNQRQRYVPLHFEDEPTTTRKPRTTKKLTTTTIKATTTIATTEKIVARDEESNSVLPEVKPESTTKIVVSTSTPLTKIVETTVGTTPYSHIQKIFKKKEKVAIVYPENSEQIWSVILNEDAKKKIEANDRMDPQSQRSINSAKRSIPKEIYIDLPVFEDDYKKIKYIPISDKAR